MEGEPDFESLSIRIRIGAILDHVVLIPLTLLYSFFVPLERSNWWLYSGLAIGAMATIMAAAASIAFATADLDRPMTSGAYAISRHPMYVSRILLYTGVGLAGTSWIFLLCAAVDVVAWRMAIPVEEQIMQEKFGEDYEDYMRLVPRWLGLPRRTLVGGASRVGLRES